MEVQQWPVWPIVCGSGPRPQNMTDDQRDYAREKIPLGVKFLIERCGTTDFLSGMAIGVDMWLAEAVLTMGARLHAHIPYEDQPGRWSKPDQRRWAELRAAAASEVVYHTAPANWALFKRNEGMLTAADALLLTWDPARREHSGTWQMVQLSRPGSHLHRPGLHIDLDPAGMTTRWGLPDQPHGRPL